MTTPSASAGRAGRLFRKYWIGIPLWRRVIAALVLGVLAGLLFGAEIGVLKWIGDLFVRLVRMLVVPLVLVMVVSGIAALGDPRKLGSIGLRTLALFLATTSAAVAIGLSLGSIFRPGEGAALGHGAGVDIQPAKSFADQVLAIVPTNIVDALARGDMLAIIFFSLALGVGMLAAGPKAEPLVAVFAAATEVMLRLIRIVMELSPLGVFALLAAMVGTTGFAAFSNVAVLAGCLLAGSAAVTLLVHGAVVKFGAKRSVIGFLRGSAEAIVMGFSTASSSAALPVAMNVARTRLGVSAPVASTVLPLGATMGMDGTAMYMALLATFAAQAFGVPLSPADYLLVGATTVLLAMGTAPIPSSSLFLMVAILAGIGISAEQAALLVAFILPFDRPLDMIRTVPNVTCDLSAALAISRWEGAPGKAAHAAGDISSHSAT